jgi:predicted 3-demethylubiquinone-9 3-methyltransferase (glyoxalase superfamily)
MTNQPYPCLWFNGQAKEAAEHYCSVFKNSRLLSENPFAVVFELNGTKFMNLNGGPEYKFTPANSYIISCQTQSEIDYYWDKLGKEGEYGKCGWLTDKFGVSWQIVPEILGQLMSNPEKAPKVMYAFMQMSKFNIETLTNI